MKIRRPRRADILRLKIKPIWIYLWVTFFALILITSISAPDHPATTFIKLGGILLCLFYSAITFPHDYLLLLAMLGTCIADLILASNNIAPAGVTVFFATQIAHLLRLTKPKAHKFIYIYLLFAIIILTINFIFKIIPQLFVAVFFYGSVLIANVTISTKWFRRERKNPSSFAAAAGFIIFFCCDFCTTLSYFSLVEVLPAFVYAPANVFVWLFYYPSQILISNSGKYDIIEQKEG